MRPYVLCWGGGDLATGVAIRLHRAGLRVLVVEQPQPLAVRRTVAFAQAVYDGEITVEDVRGCVIESFLQMEACWDAHQVPVLVDPELKLIEDYPPLVIVDARMRKVRTEFALDSAVLMIGLGPGFTAGENCHAGIETNRGHFLGRVYWQGSPQADTGEPEKVGKYRRARVLHAAVAGFVDNHVRIGDLVKKGELILSIAGCEMQAPFSGIVRGLIYPGLFVEAGTKVGDIDPRNEGFRCQYVSDKSLSIGGGVLEAILSKPGITTRLWA